MRKSDITSSITTVVAVTRDCLVVAGVAARKLLHHMNMREHLGNWQVPNAQGQRERCYSPINGQPISRQSSSPRMLESLAGRLDHTTSVVFSLLQTAFSKRPVQRTLALCPAYAAIARTSSASRG